MLGVTGLSLGGFTFPCARLMPCRRLAAGRRIEHLQMHLASQLVSLPDDVPRPFQVVALYVRGSGLEDVTHIELESSVGDLLADGLIGHLIRFRCGEKSLLALRRQPPPLQPSLRSQAWYRRRLPTSRLPRWRRRLSRHRRHRSKGGERSKTHRVHARTHPVRRGPHPSLYG